MASLCRAPLSRSKRCELVNYIVVGLLFMAVLAYILLRNSRPGSSTPPPHPGRGLIDEPVTAIGDIVNEVTARRPLVSRHQEQRRPDGQLSR